MPPSIDRIESAAAIPGMLGSIRIPGGIATSINAANQVRQVNTVTVGTATVSTTYSVIIDGIVISYASTSTDTATGIRDGLISAINLAGVGVIAAATDAGVFTITGYPGVAFSAVIVGGGVGYAISTTATASNSSVIDFGLALARAVTDKENVVRLPTSADQKFCGIALHNHKSQQYYPDQGRYKAGYLHTEPISRLWMGSAWVPIESPVTADSDVFVRIVASGAFTKTAWFTAESSVNVVKLVGARWITGGTEIAEILLSGAEIFEAVA